MWDAAAMHSHSNLDSPCSFLHLDCSPSSVLQYCCYCYRLSILKLLADPLTGSHVADDCLPKQAVSSAFNLNWFEAWPQIDCQSRAEGRNLMGFSAISLSTFQS